MALLGDQLRLEGPVLVDNVVGTAEPVPLPDHRRPRRDADRGGIEPEVAAVGFAPDGDSHLGGAGLVDDAVVVVRVREVLIDRVSRAAVSGGRPGRFVGRSIPVGAAAPGAPGDSGRNRDCATQDRPSCDALF